MELVETHRADVVYGDANGRKKRAFVIALKIAVGGD
jgi:hypothetical protein